MARRRYVSTEISVDTRVNRLAQSHGDFAALLYTWMIPHADDQGALTADAEQLLFTVLPGRRDKTVEDVADAVLGMVELGLLEADGAVLRYPPSFHKYQSYIKEQRREAAHVSAERRTSAQPVAPVLPPVPVSPPVSPSVSEDENLEGDNGVEGPAAPAAAPDPSLLRADKTLAALPGWSADPDQLRLLGRSAARHGIDLELEAQKIVDWFRSPKGKGRQCSFRFVANWLQRESRDPPVQPAPAMNGTAPKPRGSSQRKHH